MAYTCFTCGNKYSLSEKLFRCSCGSFLHVEPHGFFSKKQLARRDLSIWRYREAFGLPQQVEPVSIGEGRTPVVRKKVEDTDLLFKLDFL
ncbi:MAG: threonine synthase, partial [Deltaproteobacteria bacterium]|nr:threonine synthase [Deltaproteobacteria bacterium]